MKRKAVKKKWVQNGCFLITFFPVYFWPALTTLIIFVLCSFDQCVVLMWCRGFVPSFCFLCQLHGIGEDVDTCDLSVASRGNPADSMSVASRGNPADSMSVASRGNPADSMSVASWGNPADSMSVASRGNPADSMSVTSRGNPADSMRDCFPSVSIVKLRVDTLTAALRLPADAVWLEQTDRQGQTDRDV